MGHVAKALFSAGILPSPQRFPPFPWLLRCRGWTWFKHFLWSHLRPSMRAICFLFEIEMDVPKGSSLFGGKAQAPDRSHVTNLFCSPVPPTPMHTSPAAQHAPRTASHARPRPLATNSNHASVSSNAARRWVARDRNWRMAKSCPLHSKIVM